MIIYRELYVRFKIDKGIQELNSGKVVSHDEVKGRLEKWLN
jgi:predicted transcriptional regulator